jgi:hypothetical protein
LATITYGLREVVFMSVFKHLCYQKENGETGQCDVYDDQNECPDPRTYVNVDGRDGYVKLGEFNDPQASPLRCYVASAGREFAILKVAIPTGSFTAQNYDGASYDWTCPRLITKIKCTSAGEWDKYVNVTPGTVYTFMCVKSFRKYKWVIYVGRNAFVSLFGGNDPLIVWWSQEINNS